MPYLTLLARPLLLLTVNARPKHRPLPTPRVRLTPPPPDDRFSHLKRETLSKSLNPPCRCRPPTALSSPLPLLLPAHPSNTSVDLAFYPTLPCLPYLDPTTSVTCTPLLSVPPDTARQSSSARFLSTPLYRSLVAKPHPRTHSPPAVCR